MNLSDLTLITIGFNSAEALTDHYNSLGYDELPPHERPSCILVDNASTDETATMLASDFPWVQHQLNANNLGYGAAANVGIQQAQTRYVMILNPDTEIPASEIGVLLKELQAHPKAAMAGPNTAKAKRTDTIQAEWIIGAAMLMDTDKMKEVGYFDEQFFLYFEETDLCHRTLDAGLEIIQCFASQMPHALGESSGTSPQRDYFLSYHWGKSYRIIAEKFPTRYSPTAQYIKRLRKSWLISLLTFNSKRRKRAEAKIKGMKGAEVNYSV